MQENVKVIIPVRNGVDTIERAIKSAVNAGADKVLMYDDASVDSTFKVMIDLNKQYPTKTFYYNHGFPTRSGVNFARNFLIEQAGRGLIIPLDADDELLDIAPFVQAWSPDVWVYGDYIECDGKYETLIKGSPEGTLPRKNPTGVTMLYSTQQWAKAGGYDPDFAYAEDYGFQCALTHAGIKPKYIPSVLYRRHLRPEGNERTILAGHYWQFYRDMARAKYPSVFQGT